MRIKLIGILLAASISPLLNSQDAKVTKIVRVHGDPLVLANLAGHGLPVQIDANQAIGAVVVKGHESDVEEVERTIQELESISSGATSAKNVELVIYLVAGSMAPTSGNSDSGAEFLAPVYKQLRAVFPFKNYQLVSTMLMRSGQNSNTRTSGMLRSFLSAPKLNLPPGNYQIRYDSAAISAGNPPLIHLAKFQFSAKIPYVSEARLKQAEASSTQVLSEGYSETDIGIETNVDLREDQKVVVGTSNVEPEGDTLFLVVTAKLLP